MTENIGLGGRELPGFGLAVRAKLTVQGEN